MVGQLLTETVLLSALGGLVGVAIAYWSLRGLLAADLPLPFPISLDLSLDGTVLMFSLGVSLAAGVLFGMAPAIQGTNPDVAPTLRDESAGGGRAKGGALLDLLVVAQVAVSMVLLVGAGLFLRSLGASTNVSPGFGDAPTGIIQVITSEDRYSRAEGLLYLESLQERIAAIPGVEAVGYVDNLQLNLLSTQSVRLAVDGVAPPAGQDFFRVDNGQMDEGFLEAAGIPLLQGRNFQSTDAEGSDRVAIVSETFAQRFFPAGDPLGRLIRVNDRETLIVGLARDTKVRQLGEEPPPYLYLSNRQSYSPFVTILARTSGDAGALALEMLKLARELDPEMIVFQNTTMERHLAIMLLPRQLGALVVSGFALLALVLASIGLYGVVSYAVARRAQEVGIRLSLGAEVGDVVWMLTSGGMKLVALGGVVGLVLSAALAQFLSRLLYGVDALDPVSLIRYDNVMMTLGALKMVEERLG